MDKNRIEHEYLARLRELMARRQLNQRQLAEGVGVTPHTMGRVLKGEVQLKVPLLLKICDALETHAGGLLTESLAAASYGDQEDA